MPKQDGTGPQGQGSMTGRGYGPCGRGMNQGYMCRCGGRRFISSKNQIDTLKNEEKMIKEDLSAIQEEIASLQNEQK